MPEAIHEYEGRALFGIDPRNYDEIRPPYPEAVYDFLRASGALRANVTTLEIGAGNGLATRRLLEFGANPLTVLEPDPRFASLLSAIAQSCPEAQVERVEASFEDARLPFGHYDLVAAATSFHWIPQRTGLAKVAKVLKPGGHVALWWHVFGDTERNDPFHEATLHILQDLATSPSDAPGAIPFALDVAARLRDFSSVRQFETPQHEASRWTLTLNPAQVGALYSTFSPISRLPEAQRTSVLQQLMEVAEDRFGGTVHRNMVAAVYVARRKESIPN